jgi:hypothetical protein
MPNSFRVVTYRSDANGADTQVRATILQDFGHSIALLPFVLGAPAESTEAALRVLLEKVEAMIGRRWTIPANLPRRGAFWPHYLEN